VEPLIVPHLLAEEQMLDCLKVWTNNLFDPNVSKEKVFLTTSKTFFVLLSPTKGSKKLKASFVDWSSLRVRPEATRVEHLVVPHSKPPCLTSNIMVA
jgi:hypothetical protein